MLQYVSKAEIVKDNMLLLNEFVKKMFEFSVSFSAFLRTLETLIRNQ